MRSRVRKGRSGTLSPRDALFKGRVIQGPHRPKEKLSAGRNIRDFLFGDTSVGDDTKLHPPKYDQRGQYKTRDKKNLTSLSKRLKRMHKSEMENLVVLSFSNKYHVFSHRCQIDILLNVLSLISFP